MEICNNKKAKHKYALESKTLEVGIQLKGHEVKSLRSKGTARLDEAFILIKDNGLYLHNCYINPYSFTPDAKATPIRKLLAHKSEILNFHTALQLKPLVLIPLKLYFDKNNRVKVLISLASSKNKQDKRQTLKLKAIEMDSNIRLKH